MAIPAAATQWAQSIDPTDRTDFIVQFGSLLEAGEKIDEATVTVMPEGVALGLTILEDVDHGPFITEDTNIELTLEVDEDYRDNAAFDGSGSLLPILFTITTDATPFRRYQRTMVVKVVQL